MEAKNPKSWPPLSQLFFETVMNFESESRNQLQVNSKSVPDIDRPSSRPNCQLLQDDNRLPLPQPGHHSSVDVSRNSLGISAQSLPASCESSESPSFVSSTLQPHQHYPVPHEYFRILMEDATDRYVEASKFFHKAQTYSFVFEFHTKILDDLFEELANTPSNMEAEAYQSASTLRHRLRLLQVHLVGRRNQLLGFTPDQWRYEKINPPAGAEIYLEAAAEAKAARQRQCQMVVLVQTITDLKMKENMCKQQRSEAEAELIQYFDQLKQSSDGDRRKKYDKPETADETAPPVEKETCQNGDNVECVYTEQVRPDDNVFESSSASHNHNDSSNDRYCIFWMESSEMEKSSAADQKTPLFIRLKSSSTCLFCKELHWSHLCLKMSTLEGRFRYLCDRGVCFICGTAHKGACADSERVCKWPQCRAINSHHSSLCPNVEYPITEEVVQAYERRINDLHRIHKRPQVCEW